ncbi:MAG TPA: polysaccharide deacetylase family protein [Myxococcaceae bacterium]|nr:polysaccharide deacetylase family protein [Myxococcaceae bacterium]
MELLTVAGLAMAPAAGAYAASAFGEIRGIHDLLVPGAVWTTPKPHVVLTVDDGPHPERTPRLLDVLAARNATAVFFLLGENAKRHPGLVRRIAQAGHEIGNHSWSHPWMLTLGRRRIARELDRCQDILAELTGTVPRLARPPYGQRDYRYNQLARERGLTPVLWSRNLRDYWGSGPEVLVRRLRRAKAGDIVLLHDGDPKAKWTVEAVDAWLASGATVGPL